MTDLIPPDDDDDRDRDPRDDDARDDRDADDVPLDDRLGGGRPDDLPLDDRLGRDRADDGGHVPPDDDEDEPHAQVDGPSGSWRLTSQEASPNAPAIQAELDRDGPLSREAALLLLDRGGELMAASEWRDAARHYQRVIGFDDAAITAAALLGLGGALQRLDREEDAITVWRQITELAPTPSTYPAWKNIAAARVRANDLPGALDAYREADRHAPASEKAEIASRLGWLAKETGDPRGAGRYFARARGADGLSLTYVVIGMTIVVSLLADPTIAPEGGFLRQQLWLDKAAVAAGDWWRLFTVTLVHAELRAMPFHLLFNMYALWIAGPYVERLYGRLAFVVFYVVFAFGGSLATYAFGDVDPSHQLGVGASGAIFGMFGLLFVASRRHHPALDQRGRMFIGQIGLLIAFNLYFGFVLADQIDNLAHIGGLVAGGWLGFLIPPGRVATLRTMWQGTRPQSSTMEAAARVVGVLALAAVMVAGYTIGTDRWAGRPRITIDASAGPSIARQAVAGTARLGGSPAIATGPIGAARASLSGPGAPAGSR